MTLNIITTNQIGPGTQFTFTSAGDELYIDRGNVMASNNGTVTVVAGALNDLETSVAGTLLSSVMMNYSGANLTFTIDETGTVQCFDPLWSNAAVNFSGVGASAFVNHGTLKALDAIAFLSSGIGNSAVNDGDITAGSGILMTGGDLQHILNEGSITAVYQNTGDLTTRYSNGILIEDVSSARVTNLAGGSITAASGGGAGVRFKGASGASLLTNAGDIHAEFGYGVNLIGVTAGEGSITVVNRGTISGLDGSFRGSVNADILVNRGTLDGIVYSSDGGDTIDNGRGVIEGDVFAGAGNDNVYNDDGFISGTVSLEAGADIFSGGDRRETVMGGADNDTIDFFGGRDTWLANPEFSGSDGSDELDGGDGIDTYDASAITSAVFIRLQEERANGTAIGVDYITGFENARGGSGNDTLTGDDVRNVLRGNSGADTMSGLDGNDRLFGDAGADNLTGGAGRDVMTGGADADLFTLTATTESPSSASGRDIITDYQAGIDRIVLTAIDADTVASGDQAFTFIGTAAFSNVAGQLRYVSSSGSQYTIVQGDTNGDARADFQIMLFNASTLTVADFDL